MPIKLFENNIVLLHKQCWISSD